VVAFLHQQAYRIKVFVGARGSGEVTYHIRMQTQAGASRLAELLLRLYALAIVPLTLWVTAFVLQLPVPLEAL
jgi:hypothetical protein